MSSSLSQNLRKARLGAGLKQHGIAELACMSQQAISFYESGQPNPLFQELCRLASALNLNPWDLDDNLQHRIPQELIPLIDRWPRLTQKQRLAIVAVINAMLSPEAMPPMPNSP